MAAALQNSLKNELFLSDYTHYTVTPEYFQAGYRQKKPLYLITNKHNKNNPNGFNNKAEFVTETFYDQGLLPGTRQTRQIAFHAHGSTHDEILDRVEVIGQGQSEISEP